VLFFANYCQLSKLSNQLGLTDWADLFGEELFQATPKESEMLSKAHKLLLAQLVRENKTIIFSPFFQPSQRRPSRHVKRWLTVLRPWRRQNGPYLKRECMRTCATSNYISELDEVVLDVIGRFSPNVKPGNVRDWYVILAGVSELDFEASSSLMVWYSKGSAPKDVHVVTFVNERAVVELSEMFCLWMKILLNN
jgi:hypothetical protein